MGRGQPRRSDGKWAPCPSTVVPLHRQDGLRRQARREPLADAASRLGSVLATDRLLREGRRLGPREFCRAVASDASLSLAEDHGLELSEPSDVPFAGGGTVPKGLVVRADASWAALQVYEAG